MPVQNGCRSGTRTVHCHRKIEQYSKWLEDRVIEDAQEEYDRREQDNEQNLEEHTTISGGGETGR